MAHLWHKWKGTLSLASFTIVSMLLIMQLIPYGRDHTNPQVVREPSWTNASTRELAVRACFDCHSNETRWPWYSHIAPVSWLVQNDVDEGRKALNFSEWHRTFDEADEAAEKILEREMPPKIYLPLHSEARLNTTERNALAEELRAALGRASFDD